ncbi:IclR family transcriptional regulator [Halomarina halobia]|uniref:IclR family transcriptional regulator n=1 Tax=Halomarina halobia TaxID=3033386 RepID=A0ABD6ADL7_9EURY|nr:helix-turn-helix domain-containing protein [Halomarina sp. PSR21]
MNDSPNVPVRSVETTLGIVEEIQARNGAGVSELAEALDIAKSTVHNHLRTLERHDYVIQEDDTFQLGFRYLDLGGHVRDRNPDFRFIQPKVRKIAEETGEICQFLVSECGAAIVVFMERGEQAVETNARVGRRTSLDELTAGRVLTAASGRQGADEEIVTALETDGYVAAAEAYVKGLRAIVVPITNTNGEVLGALNVAGPAHRLRNPEYEWEVADLVLDVSNELELNVSYSRY